MGQGNRRISPALVLAGLALFVALAGSVHAARKGKPRVNGKVVRVASIPGNRLVPRSIPANRLRPAILRRLRGVRITKPLTGAEINELTLGQVPDAAHADSAYTAERAFDAETALNAVEAVNARTVNGHGAGCLPGTEPFAGACWETAAGAAAPARLAARHCARRGGSLPEALQLAAYAEEDGVALNPSGEWSGDLATFTGAGTYAVVTVNSAGVLDTSVSTTSHAYRCVIPLLR